MTEIETIARAQMYLEKLANGVDPLTGNEVAENDIINNVRISRCLFFASGILRQIVEGKGKFKVEMPDRADFTLTPEQLAAFEYSQTPLTVSELTRHINSLINPLQVKELKNGAITDWLTEIGMLTAIIVNNKTRKRPSDAGKGIGISVQERTNQYGTKYDAVYYDLNAQHFIIDNMDAIIELSKMKRKE